MVRANVLVAESRRSNGRVFNVATGRATSVLELATKIIEITGANTSIIFDKPRPGDIRHSLADISEIRKLGFEPEFSLEEGSRGLWSGTKISAIRSRALFFQFFHYLPSGFVDYPFDKGRFPNNNGKVTQFLTGAFSSFCEIKGYCVISWLNPPIIQNQ